MATTRLTLDNESDVALTGLSALHWAWFDQPDANLMAAGPTAKGSIETTDGAGLCIIDITGTALTSTQIGRLVMHNADWSRSGTWKLAVD